MVVEGKTKKRKISDFFAPLPKKVTRTHLANESKVKTENTSETCKPDVEVKIERKVPSNQSTTSSEKASISSEQALISSVQVSNSKSQSTQTDCFEIDSNGKEGLKFLAERINNFESMRIHGSYELCSIADKRCYPKNEQGIINMAHYNLDVIQENDTLDSQHAMKSSEIMTHETADTRDKMTCWGEDNPHPDFLNGMKLMAYRIRKTELSRLDYDEFTTDWQFDWNSSKPIDLVKEVADTMVGMRKLKALLSEEDQLSDLEISF